MSFSVIERTIDSTSLTYNQLNDRLGGLPQTVQEVFQRKMAELGQNAYFCYVTETKQVDYFDLRQRVTTKTYCLGPAPAGHIIISGSSSELNGGVEGSAFSFVNDESFARVEIEMQREPIPIEDMGSFHAVTRELSCFENILDFFDSLILKIICFIRNFCSCLFAASCPARI